MRATVCLAMTNDLILNVNDQVRGRFFLSLLGREGRVKSRLCELKNKMSGR